jgi:glutathione synthase/RimK-type ligase-like ATP-grasp enzyme
MRRAFFEREDMLNVLIATKPDDADSIYVKLALESHGHQVKLWYPSDIPALQSHTFRLDGGEMKWSAQGLDFEVNESDNFDVVWLRRPMRPRLDDLVHPEDLKNATNEMQTFYKAFWQTIAPKAFWVNPPASLIKVNCKLSQLKVAAQLGFQVPETIITNNPLKIRNFIELHAPGQVIYKPIYPVIWLGEDHMRLTYTKPINMSDLPSDDVLKLTPGIYQKRIEKAYELRVTCMGHTAIATKLHSQSHEKGIEDWRYAPSHELKMEPYELPEEIANKCFAFMLKFGVVFGCFDFIVTPEGEYVFLEINEQGQFLWQEERNPRIKLLDPFVNFLTERNSNYVWKCSEKPVTIPGFRGVMSSMQKMAMGAHIDPGMPI